MPATVDNRIQTLSDLLSQYTREGELYERLPDGKVRCYSCGHRCLIHEGRQGICRVRFNEGGRLYVPHGYVGSFQLDPIEKKPFFHAYPGSKALSFGMLGCDFHCSYCFLKSTRIATSEGLRRIDALFEEGQTLRKIGQEEVRRPTHDVMVYTHTGQPHRVQKLFCHSYRGKMIRIHARYLPPVECTPEHEFLVIGTPPISSPVCPHFVRAEHLTPEHLLAVPKRYPFSHPVTIDTVELLQPLVKPYHVKRTISREVLEEVMELSAAGVSSREIGQRIGKEASHVRHLRSKLNRGVWDLERLGEVDTPLIIDDGHVRLPKEHRPGVPRSLSLDTRLAKLLGYYCAEGRVSRYRDRIHSATLNFSFGHHEEALADEVIALLEDVFNVHAQKVYRDTSIGIYIDKVSIAFCFEALCGHGARTKHVPSLLYQAQREVAESFLRAYA
ncbi:MAG: radical SAM protein, partial [Candidatus Latescibacteria bacterium]|nr:radical SAM protein [Candidatus Latescibacterota bacterium]